MAEDRARRRSLEISAGGRYAGPAFVDAGMMVMCRLDYLLKTQFVPPGIDTERKCEELLVRR